MNVLKMKSCLEDLFSGEERRSDKYMCMTANEMWKEKLLKVKSPSSYITRRAVLGVRSNYILGKKTGRHIPSLNVYKYSRMAVFLVYLIAL